MSSAAIAGNMIALSFDNRLRKKNAEAQIGRPRRNISQAEKKNAAESSSDLPTIPTTASVWTGWTKYTAVAAQAPGAPIIVEASRKTSQPFKACNSRFVRRNPGAHRCQRDQSIENEKMVSGR